MSNEIWCPRRGDLTASLCGRYPEEAEIRDRKLGNVPGPDRWRLDRWKSQDRWEYPWKPRTCSYCGGVHPEDAILLVSQGWGIEGTDKGYKRYMHPPGYLQALRAYYAEMQTVGERPEAPRTAAYPNQWTPGPPLKLYVPHFDAEQIERFNAALRSR